MVSDKVQVDKQSVYMAEKDTTPVHPRRDNEIRGRASYQQLAEDIAPYLADQQFSGASNATGNGIVGQNENETERSSGAGESMAENNRRPGRDHYQGLAADMAQPLADLQVARNNGDVTDGAASGDGRTEDNEPKNRRRKGSGNRKVKTAKKGGRNSYLDLAADISRPLAQLRTPGTSDERGSQREVRMQPQTGANESLPHQESLSEYDPEATCGSAIEYSSCQSETHREDMGTRYGRRGEGTESVGHQESSSEYNPDASCGSASESCELSNFHLETGSEEMETRYERREQDSMCHRVEGTKSVAQQESLSEYNENATCGTGQSHGFHRSKYDEISEYSSIQTEESYERSFETEDFPSKPPVEFDTTYEECHSQVDGEPYSKKAKPNPEETEELSLPPPGKSYTESTQESIPEVFPGNSERSENVSVQSEELNSRYNEVRPMSSNVDSPFELCLSSEFEHMNLADISVDPADRSDLPPEKDNDHVAVRKYNNSSLVASDDSSTCSTNFGNSQGARPKSSGNVPRGKKSKRPKQNTNNAYTELAKDVAGDLSAMNKDLAKSQARTSGAAAQRGGVKEDVSFDDSSLQKNRRAVDGSSSTNKNQELFDGSSVHVETATSDVNQPSLESFTNENMETDGRSMREQQLFDGSTVKTETPSSTLLHSYPVDRNGPNTRQQASLTTDEELRGRDDVRDQSGGDFSMLKDTRGNENSSAAWRRTHDSAAEHRSQIEEQQRMVDNMAPQLQALVIQMNQQDEEEQRGYATHMYFNRPVPPRTLPHVGGRENANQGACAQGASKKPGGTKSSKGAKSKSHYIDLAGIIAPELAAMNAEMVNGHVKEPQEAAEGIHPEGVPPSTADESPDQEPVSHHESNGIDPTETGARPRDHLSFRGTGLQSRDQPRASLPYSGASGRDLNDGRGAFSMGENVSTSSRRRANGNRNHVGSKDFSGKGKRGKQKKSRGEETDKSSLIQMAENMAQSLKQLNERLEQQQRQPRSLNGHAATAARQENGTDSVADGSASRDRTSGVTNKSTASRAECSDK